MEITNTEYMVYATLILIGSCSVTLVAMIHKASELKKNIVEDGKNRKGKTVVLAENETGARNNHTWKGQYMYSTSDLGAWLRSIALARRKLFERIEKRIGKFLAKVK